MAEDNQELFADEPQNNSPDKDPSLDNADGHVIEVTQHDKNDIVLDRSYFFVTVADPQNGEIICSNVSYPVTTEKEM